MEISGLLSPCRSGIRYRYSQCPRPCECWGSNKRRRKDMYLTLVRFRPSSSNHPWIPMRVRDVYPINLCLPELRVPRTVDLWLTAPLICTQVSPSVLIWFEKRSIFWPDKKWIKMRHFHSIQRFQFWKPATRQGCHVLQSSWLCRLVFWDVGTESLFF